MNANGIANGVVAVASFTMASGFSSSTHSPSVASMPRLLLAENPAFVARFTREAYAAAQLTHHNVIQIYDIGEVEVPLEQGGSVRTAYIAMELVRGTTLRQRLRTGASHEQLMDWIAQAADGLAKAHAAGIVHRDLKPENVMVSKDGYVKILDFGLAKLTDPVTQELSILPTAIAAPTQPGTVMGTAGYMSPEQASGQPVDFRSDQFTLGAILYEMATGKRAFQRKTGAVWRSQTGAFGKPLPR